MKTLVKATVAVLISASILTGQAQNIAVVKSKARTAAAGVSVSTTNGKTTLVYKGKEVWSGKTTGKVSAKSKTVGNTEYVAAFDGDKVIWENVKGAGAKVK